MNFEGLKREADFRFSLVRLRENREGVAFYNDEASEGRNIGTRFSELIDNAKKIVDKTRDLEFFTTGYRYLIQVLPVAVVAPLFFEGGIQLGEVSQSSR